jgi:hypothetical protein
MSKTIIKSPEGIDLIKVKQDEELPIKDCCKGCFFDEGEDCDGYPCYQKVFGKPTDFIYKKAF